MKEEKKKQAHSRRGERINKEDEKKKIRKMVMDYTSIT